MADILKFRPKDSVSSDSSFISDKDDALSFSKSPEGFVDLDKTNITFPEENAPQACRDWRNQELADLFRVKQLLNSAGIINETDRGLSDEGEPWFIFLNADGDVFIHFCRIDGLYLLDSPNLMKPLRGRNFRELISDFVQRSLPRNEPEDIASDRYRVVHLERSNIKLHPSTLLAALVWTLFLASEELILVAQDDDYDAEGSFDTLIDFDSPAHSADSTSQNEDSFRNEFPNSDEAQDEHPIMQVQQTTTFGPVVCWLREIQAQTNFNIALNSYTIGLSSIAIGVGLISEWKLSEIYREALDDLESAVSLLEGVTQDKATDTELIRKDGLDQNSLDDVGFSENNLSADEAKLEADSSLDVSPVAGKYGFDFLDGATVKPVPKSEYNRDTPEAGINIQLQGSNEHNDFPIYFREESFGLVEKDTSVISSEVLEYILKNSGSSLVGFVLSETNELGFYDIYDIEDVRFETGDPTNTSAVSNSPFIDNDFAGSLTLLPIAVDGSVKNLIDTAVSVSAAATDGRSFGKEAAKFIEFLFNRMENIKLFSTDSDHIFLDFDSFSNMQENTLHVMSWTLDDGGVVATVGLRSDFDSYEMIA